MVAKRFEMSKPRIECDRRTRNGQVTDFVTPAPQIAGFSCGTPISGRLSRRSSICAPVSNLLESLHMKSTRRLGALVLALTVGQLLQIGSPRETEARPRWRRTPTPTPTRTPTTRPTRRLAPPRRRRRRIHPCRAPHRPALRLRRGHRLRPRLPLPRLRRRRAARSFRRTIPGTPTSPATRCIRIRPHTSISSGPRSICTPTSARSGTARRSASPMRWCPRRSPSSPLPSSTPTRAIPGRIRSPTIHRLKAAQTVPETATSSCSASSAASSTSSTGPGRPVRAGIPTRTVGTLDPARSST